MRVKYLPSDIILMSPVSPHLACPPLVSGSHSDWLCMRGREGPGGGGETGTEGSEVGVVALEDGHGPAGHHAGHHAGAAGGPGQEAGVGVEDCSAV